jgi:hypothetical protein
MASRPVGVQAPVTLASMSGAALAASAGRVASNRRRTGRSRGQPQRSLAPALLFRGQVRETDRRSSSCEVREKARTIGGASQPVAGTARSSTGVERSTQPAPPPPTNLANDRDRRTHHPRREWPTPSPGVRLGPNSTPFLLTEGTDGRRRAPRPASGPGSERFPPHLVVTRRLVEPSRNPRRGSTRCSNRATGTRPGNKPASRNAPLLE